MRRNAQAYPPNGSTMIVVLVVVMLTTYACYQFVSMASLEHRTVATLGERAQLECCQDSAEEFIKQVLADPQRRSWTPLAVQNNPALFRNVAVSADRQSYWQGHFTVISAQLNGQDQMQFGYGISDESARLSLDAIARWESESPGSGRQALAQLPGLTDESATAIVNVLRAMTGVSSRVSSPPATGQRLGVRAARPGIVPQIADRSQHRPDWQGYSLEELLNVPDVSKAQLYGLDRNRNHYVAQWEVVAGSAAELVDTSSVSLPLSYFLTPYSAERNVNCQGQPRIDLNQDDLSLLARQLNARLPREWADFIVAYRRYGPTGGTGNAPVASSSGTSLNQEHSRVRQGVAIKSIYDLIGARVKMPPGAEGEEQMLESPFSAEPASMRGYLPRLADQITVDDRAIIPGRININTAPPAVLRAIPGVDSALVERILAARANPRESDLRSRCHASWLLAEGWTSIDWMRQLEPFVTAHGDVFRMQLVSFFTRSREDEEVNMSRRQQNDRAFVRWEVVIDASRAVPHVIYRKDLSKLGRGFTIDVLRGDVITASTVWQSQDTIHSLMEAGGRLAANGN